ncbi:MAG: hypothetical protein GY801_37895 [bacterium]|nr:hypothetical protein [bacterium]
MNSQLIEKYKQRATTIRQWVLRQHQQFRMREGWSRLPRRLLPAVAGLLLLAVVAPAAHAWNRGDRYDRLETHLRANVENFRLALLRTYLPKDGRRAVPLPTIQKVTRNRGTQDPLPECKLTSVIDDGEVDFSSVLEMLATGDGDEIDFIVELARLMQIDPTPRNFPSCAWWGYVDERFFNWIFPDATATYWFQPFIAPKARRNFPQWLIKGKFIEERYKSYALYDTHFNPFDWMVDDPNGNMLIFDSTVTDYQMKPSDGQNPFMTPDLAVSDYGSFQVLMKNRPTYEDSLLPETNVIPMQTNTQPGFGQYTREPGQLPLPIPCGRDDALFPCPLEGMFQIPSKRLEQGVVSNVNNAYVVTITEQLNPRITEPRIQGPFALVIRGRIPRTIGSANPPADIECQKGPRKSYDVCYCQRNPGACEPIPWTGKSNVFNPDEEVYSGPLDDQDTIDMRYWSVCTAVYARPYPTIGNILPRNRFRENTGCVPDSDIIQTDADGTPDPQGGWFTLVVSTERNKPDIFKDANGGVRNTTVGANWIQGVAGVKMLINLRNMFPNDDFQFAGNRAGADSAWQSAFNAMQEYYPVVSTTCTKDLIDTEGWGACVAPAIEVDTCGSLASCNRTDPRSPIGGPGTVTASQ